VEHPTEGHGDGGEIGGLVDVAMLRGR